MVTTPVPSNAERNVFFADPRGFLIFGAGDTSGFTGDILVVCEGY
jgi:hypothetical protein